MSDEPAWPDHPSYLLLSTKLVPQDHLTSTFRKTNRIKSIVIPDDAAEIRYPDPFFPWIPDIRLRRIPE
jgi:hypothetical protein